MTDKELLVETLENAIEDEYEYFAVEIENEDCEGYEIIVNSKSNLEYKLAYYEKVYDDNLVLKNCKKIRIVDYMCGEDIESIEHCLREHRKLRGFIGLD